MCKFVIKQLEDVVDFLWNEYYPNISLHNPLSSATIIKKLTIFESLISNEDFTEPDNDALSESTRGIFFMFVLHIPSVKYLRTVFYFL